MANPEHVKLLRQGVDAWNKWRDDNLAARPDLRDAELTGAKLSHSDLSDAILRNANLREATLRSANLSFADLTLVKLTRANLSDADLSSANLGGANLSGANLTKAGLWETSFVDVDLSKVVGLETCVHEGPSTVNHRTLRKKSGPLPLRFLRGVGLPDNFIDYLPSLLNQPIQHYSCFISYSAKETAKDKDFAECLHADLQNKGVRCWFAPHDLPIGSDILAGIDAAIRLRDRVVLILSEHSIGSGWVKDEVNIGFEEERKRGGEEVLFPIRLDETVMTTNEGPRQSRSADQRAPDCVIARLTTSHASASICHRLAQRFSVPSRAAMPSGP
jgi:uncharacterized protein YjbI with pentapeptide repeats